MIFNLASGYFSWNFPSWIFLFSFSLAAIYLLIDYLSKDIKCADDDESCVQSVEDNGSSGIFNLLSLFMDSCITPWLAVPESRILGIIILVLFFCAAVFVK